MPEKQPIRYSIRVKDAGSPSGYLYMNDKASHTYIFTAEDAVNAFKQVKMDGYKGVEIHRLIESELRAAEII